jgi:hypothetical protein
MANMTPQQKAKYDKIRREKGEDAAKAFRNRALGGGQPKDGGIPEEVNPDGSPITTNPSVDPTRPQSMSVDDMLKKGEGYGDDMAKKYITGDMFKTVDSATSPEMKAYLDRLNGFAGNAFNRTDKENNALSQLEGGLAGYNSPEVQAMRESGQQEMNRQLAGQMHDAAAMQARSGVRGAAAMAQADIAKRGDMQNRGNLERDLIIANATEAQKRKETYAGTVNQMEAARFGRTNQAEGLYGAARSGEEAAKYGRDVFNTNQATNAGLAKAGVASAGTGAYTGLVGGQQASDEAKYQFDRLSQQQKDYFDYTKSEAEKNRQNESDYFKKVMQYNYDLNGKAVPKWAKSGQNKQTSQITQ